MILLIVPSLQAVPLLSAGREGASKQGREDGDKAAFGDLVYSLVS